MNDVQAALEIGTTRTVLAVSECGRDRRPRLICHAEIPSAGVRKSQILDINMATQSIMGVLHAVDDATHGEIDLGSVLLVVSGQHVDTIRRHESVCIEGSQVSEADIRELIELSQESNLSNDRELLDLAVQDYSLDSLGNILSPKGMAGKVLTLNTLHIHADHHRIEDARTAAAKAKLEVSEPLFAAVAAAEATLDDRERKDGVMVLDLGGGSTGYAVYTDGYIAAGGVIGVGGDHISSDIAHAFQATHSQAEELKIREATAIPTADDGDERVRIPGASALMDSRTISRRSLNTVVHARVRELIDVIGERLETDNLLPRLHSGIVLTGGGAALRDIDSLIQRELSTPVRIGRPVNLDGLEDLERPESFAAVAGALLYAHRNHDDTSLLGSIFKGIFK